MSVRQVRSRANKTGEESYRAVSANEKISMSAKMSSSSAVESDSESISHNSINAGGEGIKPPIRRRSSLFSLSSQEPLPVPDEKDYLAFRKDERHFSLIRNLHMADFITLLNGFSGFYSIVSCLRFTLTSSPHYVQRALFFIALGMLFDFFDGKVARLRNKASLIGQELDSLADLISFGVAPASIAFAIGLQTTLDVLILSYMVLCGLTRLARFNVTVASLPKDEKGKSKFFEGLPIPTTLWLVCLMAFWVTKGWYAAELGVVGGIWWENTFFEFHPISTIFFVQGCGMISKSLHVPKP
ncbi:hypothetical protein PACTADRAFT_48068 [Pachysolen tannophilus NRRL Y-2460]|uniref:CDP-diacylglycerol--serine O-phosphatidyltransferase n=1 Tax=Pachysolen tannophilus NRRL Y-2460 TaxID=669874 RepID=A0A1E4U2R2_PACTA|nr:hypothetical protein PACTADRAFT_48068 [Pachysolen tannophilus NRRL Y-2460]